MNADYWLGLVFKDLLGKGNIVLPIYNQLSKISNDYSLALSETLCWSQRINIRYNEDLVNSLTYFYSLKSFDIFIFTL